ncbi:MAG: nuclear transport factor 2 family protein [Pyrinomonadaceae bacterium]
MKRFFLHSLLILTAAVSLHAQKAPDAPELTRLLNEFLAGAGRNDAAVHDRFWAEDLIYTRSAGVRTNKPDLMKGVRSASAPKPGDPVTVYTAENIRIQQYGNAAVVAFKLVGNTTKADGTKSVTNHLNTGTFIKRSGKWQVVAWQATTVPNPAADAKAAETAKPPTKPLTLSSSAAPTTDQAKSASARTYLKGSRGGCYYLNSSGNKVYVDKALCN